MRSILEPACARLVIGLAKRQHVKSRKRLVISLVRPQIAHVSADLRACPGEIKISLIFVRSKVLLRGKDDDTSGTFAHFIFWSSLPFDQIIAADIQVTCHVEQTAHFSVQIDG